MSQEEVKETVATMLARIEERIKSGFYQNDKDHNEIKAAQEKLCIHVNHENELMDARIKSLEDQNLIQKGINIAQGDTNALQGIVNTTVSVKRTPKQVVSDNKYSVIIGAIVTAIITVIGLL